jgi:hypothetical protein
VGAGARGKAPLPILTIHYNMKEKRVAQKSTKNSAFRVLVLHILRGGGKVALPMATESKEQRGSLYAQACRLPRPFIAHSVRSCCSNLPFCRWADPGAPGKRNWAAGAGEEPHPAWARFRRTFQRVPAPFRAFHACCSPRFDPASGGSAQPLKLWVSESTISPWLAPN